MKKTILFLLFAVLSVANVCAQNSQNVLYVIDGKHVENFDGSQLKGKTIISYVISHPGRIYDIHDIRTTEYSKGAVNDSVKTIVTDSFSQPYVEAYAKASGASIKTVQAEAKETLYVVDGKIVPQSEIQKLSPSKIDSIKVIKDKKDHDYIKYAKEAGNEPTSIMIFKTK